MACPRRHLFVGSGRRSRPRVTPIDVGPAGSRRKPAGPLMAAPARRSPRAAAFADNTRASKSRRKGPRCSSSSGWNCTPMQKSRSVRSIACGTPLASRGRRPSGPRPGGRRPGCGWSSPIAARSPGWREGGCPG